ncbi:superoxide dismutase [Culex quinquefasciatus]|uniref:Superoxide dismutase n=1 Tax=Culex quinquefasciatus TaxID=7176 RepID=B0WE19_CULQU|nr:superoxide dismutase [Culex quinquefasciatus]|eukprot:XP_001846953.1 superoxide dismutase [Culex quinquefasciatus]
MHNLAELAVGFRCPGAGRSWRFVTRRTTKSTSRICTSLTIIIQLDGAIKFYRGSNIIHSIFRKDFSLATRSTGGHLYSEPTWWPNFADAIWDVSNLKDVSERPVQVMSLLSTFMAKSCQSCALVGRLHPAPAMDLPPTVDVFLRGPVRTVLQPVHSGRQLRVFRHVKLDHDMRQRSAASAILAVRLRVFRHVKLRPRYASENAGFYN